MLGILRHVCLLGLLWWLLLSVALPLANGQAPDRPPAFDPEPIVGVLELVLDADEDAARRSLAVLSEKIQTGEVSHENLEHLRPRLEKLLADILDDRRHPLHQDVALLAASWQNPQAFQAVRRMVLDQKLAAPRRHEALQALVASNDPQTLDTVAQLLADGNLQNGFQGKLLGTLGRLNSPRVAQVILQRYGDLPPSLQSQAIQLLTQRPAWSRALLKAIGDEQIPRSALNVSQVNQLQQSPDVKLAEMVRKNWGTVRDERNPEREQVIAQMQELIQRTEGNARRGEQVFHKLCGQCHQIYGKGENVGPDITSNGRSSFQQLLSNVFDPSLVIGASYQARTVLTEDGRILTGLLVEDSPQRVVLKIQGGKQEAIPRDAIEAMRVSQLSLMPEGVEKQLKPQEIADLFEFLALDKHPSDSDASYIPGTRE